MPPHQEELPRFLAPMLASAPPPEAAERGWAGWALEVKWDGCRAQLRADRGAIRLRTRPGRDATEEFPELSDVVGAIGRDRRVLLDGELVVLGADGRPDFAALRARLGRPAAVGRPQRHATLIVFDILHLDGCSTRSLPYARRRELLGELLSPDEPMTPNGACWRVPRHFSEDEVGPMLDLTRERRLEGVVLKRLDSRYLAGRRSRDWIKLKHRREERLRVAGWRERDGQLPEFFLARPSDDGFRPAGAAALGLDAEQRAALLDVLTTGEDKSRRRNRSGVRWAASSLSVEVLASYHGDDGQPLRDAVLREVYLPS